MDQAQRDAIGSQIRQARKARGWSQEALAEVAGVAKNTVTSMELGRSVRPGGLRSVLDALGIQPLSQQAASDVQGDVELATAVIEQWLRGQDAATRREMIKRLMRLVAGDDS